MPATPYYTSWHNISFLYIDNVLSSMDEHGVVRFTGAQYTLVAATNTVIGGVKPDGATLTVAGDGTLAVTPSAANPLGNGTAAAGTANAFSRGDHVHPTDTTLAPKASPTFTGTPLAPTAANSPGLGTTQLATTAFVRAATQTNDNAIAGQVGEYVSSNVLSGAAVSITTGTWTNVTTITLTAGDWEIFGNVSFLPAGTTVSTSVAATVSTASATPQTQGGMGYAQHPVSNAAGQLSTLPTGPSRWSLAATTTVYLIAFAAFSVSTQQVYGYLGARRVR